jgi:uncharacterized protein (TIGR03437 family)
VNNATRPANFFTSIILADVVVVNGSPVKGMMVARGQQLSLSPTPNPAQAISDVARSTYFHLAFEFLKPDGSPIGSVFATGMFPGTPPPGSPPGAQTGNMTIVGGTGAFLGARGTVNAIACVTCRTTSQAEDPSMRRINGGGKQGLLIQLLPMFRPEILTGPSGPEVLHSDFSLVNAASPARAGETLILYVKGLGPTSPSVNPGEPFPNEPLAIATSPVEVLVNGKPLPATNQIGVPGTMDTYRVDFRVPDDTVAGAARVQISAAWVTGAAVPIPVR